MKGIIFLALESLVEETWGDELWLDTLESVPLHSKGIYTSAGTYEPAEIVSIVEKLSLTVEIPVDDLLLQFGENLFGRLITKFADYIPASESFLGLLEGIDEVIHVEVKKLYPKAQLPKFWFTEKTDESINLHYKSDLKLCMLALGLIRGAGKHYSTPYELIHSKCMHANDEHCTFEISLNLHTVG